MPKFAPAARAATLSMLALVIAIAPGAALAQSCKIDRAAVEKQITRLERSYDRVLSDISCDAPTIAAHKLMCDSAYEPDSTLWRMGRLDDLASVYAYENATKTEVDRDNPPRDKSFLAARDACTDAACLCSALIEHTNASLGGESPYPQR